MNAKTYNLLKKIFPLVFKFSGDVKNLIIALVIHVIGPAVACFVMGVTIILLPVAVIAAPVLGLYGTVGAVLALLKHFNVVKAPEEAEVVAEDAADAE